MRYFFVFFLGLTSLLCSSQKEDKMHVITYASTFKLSNDWNFPAKEYTRLLVHKDKAVFQSYNIMCLDSLRVKNADTSDDRNKYFSFNDYAIEHNGNSLIYFEVLGNYEYQYSEEPNFDWKLKEESKQIDNYLCKKATIQYGGRNWVAWYTVEIPLPYGPYKFKGLPGLIIKMYDETESYIFEVKRISLKKPQTIAKLFRFDASMRIETTQLGFNLVKHKFQNMSLNERINFNSDNPSNVKLIQIDSYDSETLRSITDSSNNSNLIELLTQ